MDNTKCYQYAFINYDILRIEITEGLIRNDSAKQRYLFEKSYKTLNVFPFLNIINKINDHVCVLYLLSRDDEKAFLIYRKYLDEKEDTLDDKEIEIEYY